MISEGEVDKIVMDYADTKSGAVSPVEPESKPVKKVKKTRKKKEKKEEKQPLVESGTQTSYEEQYENAVLTEEFESRLKYLKTQIRKYSKTDKVHMYVKAMEKLLNKKII